MNFKEQRVQSEFGELSYKNKNLKNLLQALDLFCQAEFNKDITLTSIYRSEEENRLAGGMTKVHCVWRAADVSIHDFDLAAQAKIINFCNTFTYRGTLGKHVALIHQVPGGAEHLHVQYF